MKTTIYVLLIAPFIFCLASCGKTFLQRPALGALSEDVLANKKGVEALLVGAYGALDGQAEEQNLAGGGQWEASPDNWIYGSVAAGDAHKGSDASDQPPIAAIAVGNSDPSNGFFNTKWKSVYEGIARCNSVLLVLDKATDVIDADRSEISAEARFLRGYYYFDLKKMFDHVPWINDSTINFNQPNDQDIWPYIEADFQYAMNNLPETQSQVGRVNKWAAAAFLAKVYMFEHKYEQAKPLYDQIITQGVTSNGLKYDLVPDFEDNFNAASENNAESVFAIQMAANTGSGTTADANQGDMLNFPYNSPFGCCGFFQPTQDLVNSYRTNPKTGLPYLDSYNQHAVKNDMGILSTQSFSPDQGTLDPRLDWTVGRRGVPYLDWGPFPGQEWIRDQSYSGPYAPKKNVYWQATQDKYYDGNSWAPGTAINYVAMRFSDVLLMAAECEVEVGSLDKARAYVNRVRARAANKNGLVDNSYNAAYAAATVNNQAAMLALSSDDIKPGDWVIRNDRHSTFVLIKGKPNQLSNWDEYTNSNYKVGLYTIPWASKDEARKAIRFERKIELAMEGHRFFDLVRWGIADQVINTFYGYESKITSDLKGAHFTKGKNEYYPIPQRQIDLSVVNGAPLLTQNPGYH